MVLRSANNPQPYLSAGLIGGSLGAPQRAGASCLGTNQPMQLCTEHGMVSCRTGYFFSSLKPG
jgi:hypothetical protein